MSKEFFYLSVLNMSKVNSSLVKILRVIFLTAVQTFTVWAKIVFFSSFYLTKVMLRFSGPYVMYNHNFNNFQKNLLMKMIQIQIDKSQITHSHLMYIEANLLIITSWLLESVCLCNKVIPLSGLQCSSAITISACTSVLKAAVASLAYNRTIAVRNKTRNNRELKEGNKSTISPDFPPKYILESKPQWSKQIHCCEERSLIWPLRKGWSHHHFLVF